MRRILPIGGLLGSCSLCFLLLGGAASAHNATLGADCNEVTASFTSFPDAEHTVTVDIDGTSTTASWTGTSYTAHVPHEYFEGDAAFTVTATWTAGAGGTERQTFQPTGCDTPAAPLPEETEVEGISVSRIPTGAPAASAAQALVAAPQVTG